MYFTIYVIVLTLLHRLTSTAVRCVKSMYSYSWYDNVCCQTATTLFNEKKKLMKQGWWWKMWSQSTCCSYFILQFLRSIVRYKTCMCIRSRQENSTGIFLPFFWGLVLCYKYKYKKSRKNSYIVERYLIHYMVCIILQVIFTSRIHYCPQCYPLI